MIKLLEFILLGIVQGFTEPLPISSSGHLVIFQELLHINLPGLTFEAFINFGSTVAIILFFWKDIKRLFFGGIRYLFSGLKENTEESNYLWKIFFATLPLVFLTITLKVMDIEFEENIKTVGYALFITALALLFICKKQGYKEIKYMSFTTAFLIGIGQMIALMPGISRSGMTIVFAIALGLTAKEAFNFSFIMFIPASIGALFVSVYDIISTGYFDINFLISAIFAFIFTLIGLVVLKRTMIQSKLIYFSIYCFFVSILCVVL